MSKRKPSSPYKNPPLPVVRNLMRRGWRRCDAEALFVVMGAVLVAEDANEEQLRTLTAATSKALQREPVLGGAMLLVAPIPRAAHALSLLIRARVAVCKDGIYRLFLAAQAAELGSQYDASCFDSGFEDDEDLDD